MRVLLGTLLSSQSALAVEGGPKDYLSPYVSCDPNLHKPLSSLIDLLKEKKLQDSNQLMNRMLDHLFQHPDEAPLKQLELALKELRTLREAHIYQQIEDAPPKALLHGIQPRELEDLDLAGLGITISEYVSQKEVHGSQLFDPIKEKGAVLEMRRKYRLSAEILPAVQDIDQIGVSLIRKFKDLYFSEDFHHEIVTEDEGDHYLVGTYKAFDGDAFTFTLTLDGIPVTVEFTNGTAGATKNVVTDFGPRTIHFFKKEVFPESKSVALYRGEKLRTFSVGFELANRKEITR